MSWFDSAYTYRAPLLVDNHASSATASDVEIVIPKEWPEFWDVVLANGNDVRVTSSDGVTLETFDLESFNKTNRVGTIEIDDMDLTDLGGSAAAVAGVVGWLYWGNADASSGETTFTINANAKKTGHISVGVPGSGTQRTVVCRPEAPGAANPRTEVSKMAGEEIHLWWDLSGVLARRRIPSQGSRAFEEIHNVTYRVDDGGSAQSGLINVVDTRMAGSGFVRTTIKAGASGTNYVAVLLVELTEGRKLEFRCTIRVKDPVEPS